MITTMLIMIIILMTPDRSANREPTGPGIRSLDFGSPIPSGGIHPFTSRNLLESNPPESR